MTKTEAVQVNLIYLIFKLVHFLVDTSDIHNEVKNLRQYLDQMDSLRKRIDDIILSSLKELRNSDLV